MKKNNQYILFLVILSIFFVNFLYAKPLLQYTEETPPTNKEVILTANIQIDIQEPNIKEVKWDWNGEQYPLYDSGLVLMSNFDNVSSLGEVVGSTVRDISLQGNDAVLYGSTWTANGKYGGAYNFDGVSNYISVDNDPSINQPYNFTISLWAQKKGDSTSSYGTLYSKYEAGGSLNQGYLLYILDDTDVLTLAGRNRSNEGYKRLDGPILNENEWYHLVVTFEQFSWKLYVNGLLYDSIYWTNGFGTNNIRNLYIGKLYNPPYDDSRRFNGNIDELRIRNRVFSSGEIQQLYYGNLSKYDTDKWKFTYSQPFLDKENNQYSLSIINSGDEQSQSLTRSFTFQNPRMQFSEKAYPSPYVDIPYLPTFEYGKASQGIIHYKNTTDQVQNGSLKYYGSRPFVANPGEFIQLPSINIKHFADNDDFLINP